MDRVLVVDDDPDVREAVETALELDGHKVATATDGLAALKRLGQTEFDAVVLDVLMPNLDGFDVCRRLRASGNRTPILILTARDSEEDTIRGLDLGADDYLVKPFGLGELLARVRALLRRTRPVGEDAPLWFAGLSLDRQTRAASRDGRRLELTRTEYALLELFLRNPRQVLPRELIVERIWNYDFGPTSSPLEVYISYLRRKTEAGGEPRLIHTVRSNLHDQIDTSLVQSAEAVASKWDVAKTQPLNVTSAKAKAVAKLRAGGYPPADKPNLSSDGTNYFQLIPSVSSATNGTLSGAAVARPKRPLAHFTPNGFVPLLGLDELVARGLAPPYFRDVRYRSTAMRLYTTALPSSKDGLVRTARPLTEANATITRVRWLLLALTLGGALAAGLLGRLAANAVLRPVRALAGMVREVSATRDLNQRIPVSGRDELASLAGDFNAMLATLAESQQAQQQLIADASHELRTPLTAHRANIELLARPDLPVQQRQRVLGAAVRAMERLSALVGDLIVAARDGRSVDAREPLALDELVASAVERAQHRAPELRFESRLEPYRVVGAGSRLERAVDNVLDNAIKWSPPGDAVEIGLDDGRLTVRDHGPGIAEADLPHVFDRFYRAPAARALPGSGLGLAIVKQTVEDHGGSVTVVNADGGGALVTLRFAANGR